MMMMMMTTVIMRSMKLWKRLHDRNLLCSSQINNTSHKHTPWCASPINSPLIMLMLLFWPVWPPRTRSPLISPGESELWPKSKWAIRVINGNQCWLRTNFGIIMSVWILYSIQLDESLSLDDGDNTTCLTASPCVTVLLRWMKWKKS